MRLQVLPGKYVVAVSGGVDSMVLLDLLRKLPDVEIVVAHFNHNIREDSIKDEILVSSKAMEYQLPFEVGYGNLGSKSSEDQARKLRYEFLRQVRDKHEAGSIITAHHQDDLIETALINILRGTGPRGLVSMILNTEVTRPLLEVSKRDILAYAAANNLGWNEDSTNANDIYLRNYLRNRILNKLNEAERQEILDYVKQIKDNYHETDDIMEAISDHLFPDQQTLKRSAFILLPNEVAAEVVVRWLRRNNIFADRASINRLVIAIKTARPNTAHNIDKLHKLKVDTSEAHLVSNVTSA
jgi:tRNA(Ile)-lysidine synthase